MGASALIVCYLIFTFILIPILGLLMDLGRSLAGGVGGRVIINKSAPTGRSRTKFGGAGSSTLPPDLDGRNYPSLKGIRLRPIQELKEETMKRYDAMKNRRHAAGGYDAAVLETLEDLVPDWLHRNDPLGESGDRNSGDNDKEDAGAKEDDEEGRVAETVPRRDANVVNEKKAGDNSDSGGDDVDGNPEEGIDAIGVDDDIDEARGDDAIQEQPEQNANKADAELEHSDAKPGVEVAHDDAFFPKERRNQPAETRHQRSLQNMYDLPPSSSCPADLSQDDISTTLVTQCSLNRVDLLVETCNRWGGPIVLSLFLANEEEEEEWSGKQSNWEEMCPQLTVLPHIATAEEREDGAYPVNLLRNIGLDAVKTSHVFMMDVDFIPSVDLHATIGDVLNARHKMQKVEGDKGGDDNGGGARDALIVPAFERKLSKPCQTIAQCQRYINEDSNFIPKTVDGLRDCTKKGDKEGCIVFQSDNNWEGHHTTHSEQWLKGDWYDDGDYREPRTEAGDKKKRGRKEKIDLARKIKSVKCFDSLRYEPWVVIRWCPSSSSSKYIEKGEDGRIRPVAPYFDERFHGYGKNKIEMTSHLRFLGYEFSILPMSFIIHQPHPVSKAKIVWQNVEGEDLHYDMDSLYPKFLRELAMKYDGGKNAIPTCRKKKGGKRNKESPQGEEVDRKKGEVRAGVKEDNR